MHHYHHEWNHHDRRKKTSEASITTGIVLTIAFGAAWIATGGWFWVFPMVFAGVLPAVEGFRRLMVEKRSSGQSDVEKENYGEKQVLKTAKDEKGIVTPALVALKTSLSINQAEKILEKMAQMGYAVMHVRDNGRIDYEFPEFTTRLEERDAGRS